MSKKILVLPSWYACKDKFIGGAFFYEQSKFLFENQVADFRVIYGQKKSSSFLKFIICMMDIFIFNKVKIEKEYLSTPPDGYGFIIPNNRKVPDWLLLMLSRKMYQLVFEKFEKKGWFPDLIHCQSGMDASIFALDFNKKYDIPFVITEQQVFVFHYYTKQRAELIMDAFHRAVKIGAGSYGQRTQILMNQPDCNPEVIWNLVNENNFRIELKKRSNIFTIITLLNSLPIKGYQTFLEAIAEIVKVDSDIRFIMVGKGGDLHDEAGHDSSFVTYSKKIGVFEYGTFYPFVSRENVNDIFNQAHVFVSPTIFEPHGIAVREAMMCGMPIVTTANGGVEDSVTSETGLIVPVKQPNALAEAIMNVKKNYSNYHPERIRELAISQCGKEVFLKSMLDFYLIKN